MNNSKKAIKYREQKKQKKVINPKIWIVAGITLVVILIASLLFDQLYKKKIFSIDEDNYYLEDLTYYFNVVEINYEYLDQYYGQLFGSSYWNMTADAEAGTTMRDAAKDEAVQMSLLYEILHKEALADGYSVTEEEDETIADQVDLLINEQFSEKMIEHNGFTEEYLTEVLRKQSVVDRYRLDIINSLDIDDEAIKATFDYVDYRQYDIDTLFISKSKKDDEGKQITLTEEEKTDLYNKLNAYYDDALASDNWSKLLSEDEDEVTYNSMKFFDTNTSFSDETKSMILSMENGDISELIEEESGYYLIKMVNNASTESYDSTVSDAIRQEENNRFQEEYDEILKKYDYKIYKSGLKSLYMGQVTLVD